MHAFYIFLKFRGVGSVCNRLRAKDTMIRTKDTIETYMHILLKFVYSRGTYVNDMNEYIHRY